MRRLFLASICLLFLPAKLTAETPKELRVGRAGHAFDHLGGIGQQAEAAAASGSTIIYASGIGDAGYQGLPADDDFQQLRKNVSEYSRRAKELGIELNIGYVCATSIVNIDKFDKNWSDEFRAQFKTQPMEWQQVGHDGKPLASWYGGDYSPACMNNPDWRAYERAIVRYQLETGHDGIFFDNPTVHPQGCYCTHCMKSFAKYLKNEAKPAKLQLSDDVEAVRKLADSHPEDFLRFRGTIARDFLKEMRAFAREINPRAVITCNNSLNSPGVFYSQCRMHGYNIDEMSKAEDLVVVEDMNSQPRMEANGQTIEYGSIYKLLHGINHGKPIVAVTIAGGDYHTPPNLMRLAMAEAAAHGASYLAWPTWPEDQRQRMITAIRPQADLLRQNEEVLNEAPFRTDVALYSPFYRWVKTDQCGTSAVAAALTKENIQYRVVSEVELGGFAKLKKRPPLIIESRSILSAGEEKTIAAIETEDPGIIVADRVDWMQRLRDRIAKPSVTISGAPSVRAVIHDRPNRTIVHLYNLGIQRLSSFEDKVTPATEVAIQVRARGPVRHVRLMTADEKGAKGELQFQALMEDENTVVSTKIPRLDVSTLMLIE